MQFSKIYNPCSLPIMRTQIQSAIRSPIAKKNKIDRTSFSGPCVGYKTDFSIYKKGLPKKVFQPTFAHIEACLFKAFVR